MLARSKLPRRRVGASGVVNSCHLGSGGAVSVYRQPQHLVAPPAASSKAILHHRVSAYTMFPAHSITTVPRSTPRRANAGSVASLMRWLRDGGNPSDDRYLHYFCNSKVRPRQWGGRASTIDRVTSITTPIIAAKYYQLIKATGDPGRPQ